MADNIDKKLAATMELERRAMEGDPSITPEIKAKIDARMKTYRAQGLAKPLGEGDAPKLTEFESKSTGFYGRALDAEDGFLNSGLAETPRSTVSDWSASTIPTSWQNALDSESRQKAEQAKRNFILASLRLESGATIGEDEFERQNQAFFPQPNDGPEVIAQKAQARKQVIEGFRITSGAGSHQVEGFREKQKEADSAQANQAGSAAGGAMGAKLSGRASATPTDPNKPTPPIDPDGVGEIGFNTKPGDREDALPEGAAQFQQELQDLIARGVLTTPEQIIQYGQTSKLNEGRGFVIPPEQAEAAMKPGARVSVGTPRFQIPEVTEKREGSVFGPVGSGVADVVTMGTATPVTAGIKTLFGEGTMRENLARQRAVDTYDEENNFGERLTGQIVGGFALPSRIGAVAGEARQAALAAGETIPTAALSAARAGTRRGVIESGLYGTGYGAGSSESLADIPMNAVTTGGTAALAGFGLGKLGERLARRAALRGAPSSGGGVLDVPSDLPSTASRLNIKPSPATVGGGFSEGMQAGLGNMPGSLGPVRSVVDAETDALAAAAKNTAASMGPVSTPQRAGEVLARGARVSDRVAGRDASRLYEARTAMMGGETAPVTMGGSQGAIAKIVAEFPSNDTIADLLTHPLVRKLESADARELTLGEATELLSQARLVKQKAAAGKAPGRLRRQIGALEQAIEDDVMRAAQASDAIAGRSPEAGAAATQRQADKAWAERMRAQERELKKPLASAADDVNVSNEGVYRQLFNDMAEAGGNLTRLKKTLDKMPRRARETFAASAFDDLGRATNSAQNGAGDAWSFNTFGTNWAKMSDDAKKIVFRGRGVDREIDDIVRYVDRLKQLDRSRNFSGTGRQIANSSFVGALATAFTSTLAGTGSVGAATGATAAIGSLYPTLNLAGRAFLKTPAMRQWLRSAGKAAVSGNEDQARSLVRRLPSIAARNPTLSNEIGQLEQALLRAANDNVSGAGRVAAKPEGATEDK